MNIHQETDLPQMGNHWINGEWVNSATVVKAVNPSTGRCSGSTRRVGESKRRPQSAPREEPLTPALGLMTLNSDRGRFSNSLTDLLSERKRLR